MRIIQIIDSLEVGGAEKMAVSYANSLATSMEFSGLVVTRKEGCLKSKIKEGVNYFFLNRKYRFDFSAILRLRSYCKQNDVRTIQAHSSSFFIACMVKLIYPKVKILWHDHHGIDITPRRKGTLYLQIFSLFFKGVISVNTQLEEWAKRKLFCKNVIYLQNFVVPEREYAQQTFLKGEKGKRVLYLANLRLQKNHFLLLDVIEMVHHKFPAWTFHFVGNDLNDYYSKEIKSRIIAAGLEDVVFIYGLKQDVSHIIDQCDIGVFTSNSEGLPVALLEYGLNKKPVVSTEVGQIPFIVEHHKSGFISQVKNARAFSENLSKLMQEDQLRADFGQAMYRIVMENYSEEAVLHKYIAWIKVIKKIKIHPLHAE